MRRANEGAAELFRDNLGRIQSIQHVNRLVVGMDDRACTSVGQIKAPRTHALYWIRIKK